MIANDVNRPLPTRIFVPVTDHRPKNLGHFRDQTAGPNAPGCLLIADIAFSQRLEKGWPLIFKAMASSAISI
jgi:hypothetical protein